MAMLVFGLIGCADAHPSVLSTTEQEQAEPTPATSILASRGSAPAATETTDETDTSLAQEPASTTLTGSVVSAESGLPLAGAVVSSDGVEVITGPDGRFSLEMPGGPSTVSVRRSAWIATELDSDRFSDSEDITVSLEPLVVRALRVSPDVAASDERFDELLDFADRSTVNALVFDTKDESDSVLYDTQVDFAYELGVVRPVYDPAERLAQAREHGLYAVTRVVTFEDAAWAAGAPEAKLAGAWVDAADTANWRYPIDLAVEACQLGFDEVQFDYVRFPSGRTAEIAADLVPQSVEARSNAIAEFLDTARTELAAEGCAVSAAIFGIVMSSETDERLGQTPETISASVDAVSPMLYPSHYNAGWLGFDDPNDHPGPVIAHALDTGSSRVATDTAIRPWLQGFFYGAENVRAQIDEAEARGAGWIIWNFSGNYALDWLPSS